MKFADSLFWYSKDVPVTHLAGRGFSCNVFAIDQGDEVWLIDTGVKALGRPKRIMKAMRRDGLDPSKITHIFLTHAHPDHANGTIAFAREARTAPEILIHEADGTLLAGGNPGLWALEHVASRGLDRDLFPAPIFLVKIGFKYGCGSLPAIQPTRLLQDGDIFHGARFDLEVLHTPGHTAGHACFWLPQNEVLFVGDLIDPSFDHKASLNLPSSNFEDIYHSIERIIPLDIEFFCAAHAKSITNNVDVNREICTGTLRMLDFAKERTVELLQESGGMRLKDFYGKFPKATWMLQDQLCVPYSVIKFLEAQGKVMQEGHFFRYKHEN